MKLRPYGGSVTIASIPQSGIERITSKQSPWHNSFMASPTTSDTSPTLASIPNAHCVRKKCSKDNTGSHLPQSQTHSCRNTHRRASQAHQTEKVFVIPWVCTFPRILKWGRKRKGCLLFSSRGALATYPGVGWPLGLRLAACNFRAFCLRLQSFNCTVHLGEHGV